MDSELFDLCKEVYKRIGWDDESLRHKLGEEIFDRPLFQSDVNERYPLESYCPLYTPDYLLGKLRNYDFTIVNLNQEALSLTSDSLDDPEAAILGKNFAVVLLKLVTALLEAGELK